MIIKKVLAASLSTLILAAPLVQADVYELRTYTTYEGRLADLLARFENHTVRLFERHGMHNVAYWVPQDQPDTLIYIISHADREAATANWDAFRNDEDWLAAREASRQNGALVREVVSVFMDATSWSPMQ